MICLADIATVIRSKNAGPFVLTLDVFFKNKKFFNMVRDAGSITIHRIAEIYGVEEVDVQEVTFFEPAAALKISITRWVSSAAPGDTDVFGAQQHVPLMLLEVNLTGA
ncbi:MAG: DUF4387 domain-containing protein [Deltaproteobacteria bacterium]|nr:DUF4387 domain-containing protein [Deltaproteobacteria bacterium]